MVLLSDFDGTLAVGDFLENWFMQHPVIERIKLVFLPLVWLFYFLRPGIGRNISLIQEKKAQGWQIIIASANLNNRLNRRMISLWLYRHGISFDVLFLRDTREGRRAFKLLAIEAFKPDIVLENNKAIIKYLVCCLKTVGFVPRIKGMVMDLVSFEEYDRLRYS